MDIITATKIIQEQADSNGNSFDDEFWNIANNLTQRRLRGLESVS